MINRKQVENLVEEFFTVHRINKDINEYLKNIEQNKGEER